MRLVSYIVLSSKSRWVGVNMDVRMVLAANVFEEFPNDLCLPCFSTSYRRAHVGVLSGDCKSFGSSCLCRYTEIVLEVVEPSQKDVLVYSDCF